MLDAIDRLIDRLLRAIAWLALPVAALLFLQWPLRDIVKAYSRDANDLGQWLFALLIAASITAATRARGHLASDIVARRYRPGTRATIAIAGTTFALLPWALFVAIQSWPQIVASVRGAERFPDTGNPGYFVIKAALLLMLALIVLQALVDLVRWCLRPRDAA